MKWLKVGVTDSIEDYSWDAKNNRIDVSNTYIASGEKAGRRSEVKMRAYISNPPTNSQWSLHPKVALFYVPLNITYLIPYLEEDQSYVLVLYVYYCGDILIQYIVIVISKNRINTIMLRILH